MGLVCARSGLASKEGLAPANKVGVIDADYRGELMVALHNHSGEERVVEDGQRVAQLVVVPYLSARFAPAEELRLRLHRREIGRDCFDTLAILLKRICDSLFRLVLQKAASSNRASKYPK